VGKDETRRSLRRRAASRRRRTAQEECARTRDELLDLDIEVEVTDDQEIVFREPKPAEIDYDPEMMVESIDGSQDPPRQLRTLSKVVDLEEFLAAPICIAIGNWTLKGVPKEENRYHSLCGMAERGP
jgi:hypothetical protein